VNPFFFGDSERQLFGVYEPAQGRSERGAVLCYPWAREYLLSHPTVKVLAHRLAEAGWHSLRFDYYGTGDSAGSASDVSQGQCVADIATAVEELKEVAGVKEVALVGMRYGAALTALAAKGRSDVSKLVLWDPVTDGRRYLAELGVASTNGAPEVDVQGTVLSRRLRDELAAVTPSMFGSGLPRTLLLSTEERPTVAQAFAVQLEAAGVEYTIEHVADVQVWREEWGRGGAGLGVSAVSRITSWLD
jgi:pimeloyl-ACP methyl ester carboxylesterase